MATHSRTTKPRVLIVGPVPPPFIGPAVATKRLAESPTLAAEFEVELCDISDRDGLEEIGALNRNNIVLAFRHGRQFLRAIMGRRPDVVYISIARGLWGFIRDILFLAPSRALRIPVVAHLRAGRFDVMYDNGAFGRLVARFGMRCASRGVVLAESLRGVFGSLVDRDDIRVVTNGLPIDPLRRPSEIPIDAAEGELRLAYVSNLFRDKGIHVMIAALPAIRRVFPQVVIRFAGRWLDAAYERECRGLVESLGVQEHVEFIGVVSGEAKRELLAWSDLVAFVPVKPEGLPWVVLEAMEACRPVVGTPQGSMAEVIVDGETGALTPPDDPGMLAATIIRTAKNREAMRRMGASGRLRLEQRYSEQAAHGELVRVLNELVDRS